MSAAKKKRPPRRKVKLKYPLPSDPKDSERLLELREIIDGSIGWRDEEQMEEGDYAERLREVARILHENGLTGPHSVAKPLSEQALKSARCWGAEAEANPGSTFQDYAYDIALKAGYKRWSDVPRASRKILLDCFKDGREEERRLIRAGK